MDKQVIISVGREFGSGGHDIAENIAKHYGLPLYDYNLLREVATDKNVDVKELQKYDEMPTNKFLYRRVNGYSNSPAENIAQMQFEHIKKKAESGKSFVVVGRCSETILRGHESLITFFILGDMECKIERIMGIHKLSRDAASNLIKHQDKARKTYHNYFCAEKWGDSRNYDFSINSSKLGIEETTKTIIDYIDKRMQNM